MDPVVKKAASPADEAEELAAEAEAAKRRGDVAASIVLYTQSAERYEKTAREVPGPRMRLLLAKGAITLWLKAGKQSEAERVAKEFGAEISP